MPRCLRWICPNRSTASLLWVTGKKQRQPRIRLTEGPDLLKMLFTYAPGKIYFLEAAPCIQLVSFLSYILWLKTALCETICRDNEFVWARAYCSTTWGTWWVSCVSFWDRALLTHSLRSLDSFDSFLDSLSVIGLLQPPSLKTIMASPWIRHPLFLHDLFQFMFFFCLYSYCCQLIPGQALVY